MNKACDEPVVAVKLSEMRRFHDRLKRLRYAATDSPAFREVVRQHASLLLELERQATLAAARKPSS